MYNGRSGTDAEDVYWCAADVGWLTFPIQAVIGGLAQGATLVCFEGALDTPSKTRFYEIANKHGVTKILIAPTALRMLRSVGDEAAKANPIAGLKLITCQGEPLDPGDVPLDLHDARRPPADHQRVRANGDGRDVDVHPVYGVEALKAGSCGTPVPGHACEVLTPEGQRWRRARREVGLLTLLDPFPGLARTVWDDHERYVKTYFSRFPGQATSPRTTPSSTRTGSSGCSAAATT